MTDEIARDEIEEILNRVASGESTQHDIDALRAEFKRLYSLVAFTFAPGVKRYSLEPHEVVTNGAFQGETWYSVAGNVETRP